MNHSRVSCKLILNEHNSPSLLPLRHVTYHAACLSFVHCANHGNRVFPYALRITPQKHAQNTKFGLIKSRAIPLTCPPLLHTRFVRHGKATLVVRHRSTIKDETPRMGYQLMLSDCDPRNLRIFLITIRVKLRVADCVHRASLNQSLRTLLGNSRFICSTKRNTVNNDENDLSLCSQDNRKEVLTKLEEPVTHQENVSMMEEVSIVGDYDQLVLYTENLYEHFSKFAKKLPSPIRPIKDLKKNPKSLLGQLLISPSAVSRRIRMTGTGTPTKPPALKPLTSTPQRNGLQRLLFPEATDKASEGELEDGQPIRMPLAPRNPNKDANKAPITTSASVNKLNAQQEKVLQLVLSGQNVFFTGGAGTGKSFLIRRILEHLPPSPKTIVTASTGVAAYQIGGRTVHSFAGVARAFQMAASSCGLLKNPVSYIEKIYLSSPELRNEWMLCQHFLLDEISLIDADSFYLIDYMARVARGCLSKPFGGIQVILSGDFLQLPPVKPNNNESVKFAFQSPSWSTTVTHNVLLTEVHRQTDQRLLSVLQLIREGHCPPQVLRTLHDTAGQSKDPKVTTTILCTHKYLVDRENEKQMELLSGSNVAYLAEDGVVEKRTSSLVPGNARVTTELNGQTPACPKLNLKIGARVMLIKNLDVSRGLVNGTRGVVVAFQSQQTKANSLISKTRWNSLPVVSFEISADAPPLTMIVRQESWRIKTSNQSCLSGLSVALNNQEIWLERRQLPLVLAWACSVHKSQGMTLDFADIYLDSTFECGQAYVALSRCRSLSCMRVMRISPQSICANPIALEFYRTLKESNKHE